MRSRSKADRAAGPGARAKPNLALDEARFRAEGLTKCFGGVKALDGASLSLEPGEVHALVGENGAGKSTLIKAMAGIVRLDAGRFFAGGSPVSIASGSDASGLGLSFIHQELNLVPYFAAAENVFLGKPYPKNRVGLIDRKELDRRAAAALSELGTKVPLDVPAARLSRGQRAMVALARAFAADAAIYVMDEPTAALTDEEAGHLFDVIRGLRDSGRTVLYVSHRLDEIFALCDRVTVMRDGRTVSTARIADTDQGSLIKAMIGRGLEEAFPPKREAALPLGEPSGVRGEELLTVERLEYGKGRRVSFRLGSGEILGVAGLAGSGRSSLLKTIAGAYGTPRGGTEREGSALAPMTLAGAPYRPASPRRAIDAGVVLVPEERREQGLVVGRSIGDNMALPHLAALSRLGVFVDRKREAARSEEAASSVRLKAASLRQRVGQLSGGNQQKVVFAKWLLGEVKVLLLDEPTRGVDVGARYEIYRIVRDLAAAGAGVVLASSDLNEVLGMADRVLVLRDGAEAVEVSAKGLDQETALGLCFGEGEVRDGR